MSDHYWLTEPQLERIKPWFPRSHGRPRVDDRRAISGIIHVIRNGLRWRDAPEVYGPLKTLYNRFFRWSRRGVFNRILSGLAAGSGRPPRSNRTAPKRYSKTLYKQRHKIENMFAKLKDWRRIATRYDR